ncbi:MAG: hypothetical protein CMP28_14610 [Roseibacillus sp.]|nr:hypothetical protein [Roseibacillus sp.]
MTSWILRALGVEVDDVDGLVEWALRWQLGQWGILAAVLMGILTFVCWWLYKKSPQEVSGGRRFLLTFSRLCFLALLLAILLQPVLVLTLEREVPRTLPVIVDRTGSMALVDADGTSRLQKVNEALNSEGGVSLLSSLEKELKVSRFSFDADSLEEVENPGDPLTARGEETALGDVLHKAMERYRGAFPAGFVVISDGGQNSGEALGSTAQQLKEAGIPVFAIGVGDVDARDVAIESVEVREVLLADDAAPVSVKLRTQGMAGGSGRVIFSLGGVEVAAEEVDVTQDGLQEVSTLFIPKRVGEYVLEARFETDGPGEALDQNNTGRAALRVVDRRLRVLLVDQAPRWEFKYLEAMLLRERRVDLSCFLFEGDREIAQVAGSPYLEQFPLRPEDLFDFDLVLLGDVDPRYLPEGHLALLGEYVSSAGGALVVIAGKRYMPSSYRRTMLEQLLPVELAGASIGAANAAATRPLRLNFTPAGRQSVMLQLGDDPAASEALWRSLPPIYWTARVERAKPAAEVLLTRPEATSSAEATPVVALHRYGAGEVLFMGTDNFWRFRRNVGDRYHSVLWGQIIQRMAGARLLTEVPRVTLKANKRRFRQGDRVRIYARLFTSGWEPREEEVVEAILAAGDDPGRRQAVALRAIPGQLGIYRAEFAAGTPGNYRLALPGDEVASVDFTVRDDNREYARASLNEALLRDLAGQTGGAYFPLEQLELLPAALTERSARLTSLKEVDLWSSPLFFVVLILLLTGEWIGRKVSELK